MIPVLAYWKMRCLAQPIRLLLKYAEVEFVDKTYPVGPAPEYDKTEWYTEKNNLGLDFPNLPYYIDEDVKISQSKAILRYLGWKHNLCGSTSQEKARIEMLAEQANDDHWEFINLAYYDYDEEDKKKKFLDSLPKKMKSYSDFLDQRKWFAGERISYADILTYEVLDQLLFLEPNCLKDFKNLEQFHSRFEDLPAIKKYMASTEYIRTPLNSKYAKFGNV